MMGALTHYMLVRPMTKSEVWLWVASLSLFLWVLIISAVCKLFLGG